MAIRRSRHVVHKLQNSSPGRNGAPVLLFILIFAIGFFTHFIVQAQTTTSGTKISSCVQKNGTIKIVPSGTSCGPTETLLEWNQSQPAPGPNTGGGGSSGLPLICFSCQIENKLGNVLVGKDLHYSLVVNSQLTGADLTDVNFSNATFESSSLKNATLRNTNFSSARMTGVDFGGAVAEKAQFGSANLSKPNFTGTNLTGSTFQNVNMSDAIWSGTTCPDGTNSDANGNTCDGHLNP